MNVKTREHEAEVRALLEEGYGLWEESGLQLLPESERFAISDAAIRVYSGEYAAKFAAACQCFYLFRNLHARAERDPAWATLLGDYFFSQFSKHLIPIDSVPLIDAFSRYLANDARKPASTGAFLAFVESLPAVMKS